MDDIRRGRGDTDEIDVHLGRQLRLRRGRARLSQSDLGQALKVAPQQLQKYESGMNRIPAKRLYLAALALKCRPGDFFEGLPGDGESFTVSYDGPWKPEELTDLVPELFMLPRVSAPVRRAIAALIRASAVGPNAPERRLPRKVEGDAAPT